MNQQPDYQVEKTALIKELSLLGIKHTPEKIVRIARQPDGKIVFLEEGNTEAGLQHILENHFDQFTDVGIEPHQIPDAVIAAVTQGRIVGYQGRKKTRLIYEVSFNSKIHYIAVTISNNGYIVGANPRTSP
ncbi:hypothetical protein WA1_19700 [Scytonema hofmannii PCC 7110]|uniref:DUF4258 domain-containing protein n=1 Tax=Scytonema hofmannii PCC 7110 TaxID=128403 RepID=A0A139XBY8_9CYAN|nr:hypothetical protein [Scytonema hofmannii]KYC42211.1 hypothetical protein WA1_19700 [Scytonema hofmannii PCC 7110]